MEQAKRFSATLILSAMILTAAILLMAIPKTWKEAVRQNEDGSYSLSRIHPENMNRPVIGTPGAKNYWHRLVIPPGNGNLN